MTIKDLAGRASFQVVRFILIITMVLPVKCSFGFCAFNVFVGSRFKWKRKKVALDNLKIVFPELGKKERLAIFRKSLRNNLKDYFEVAFMVNGKYPEGKISEIASASGLEHMDRIRERGQGALLLSGHFGNFALMIIWLAIRGYPVPAIYKEAKHFPDNFFGNIMRKFNVTPLKYSSDASLAIAIIRALKEKKIVLIQNDQSHPNGVYVDFFNKSVPTPPGPALLAKRVGVPIIPAYVYRDRSNHHHITVLPEIPLVQDDDHDKFLLLNTQNQMDWIAEILVKHPTEWLWLHRRWKRARNADNPI
jgi:KDO2-lipid IV(A) lauroyltransferase